MYAIIIGIIMLIQGIVTLLGSTRGIGKEYRGRSFTDAYRKFTGLLLFFFGGLWIGLYLAHYGQIISQSTLQYSLGAIILLFLGIFLFGESKYEKIWLKTRKKDSDTGEDNKDCIKEK